MAANAANPKVRPSKPCRHCQQDFIPDYRAAVFCSRTCSSHWQAARIRNRAVEPFVTKERAEWLKLSDRERDARTRAIARAFVKEVNARTVCAHCGAKKIEWHNPEHVELNRQSYRISRLVGTARSIEVIKAEMARCTPLCRRCHMKEDGRLKRFVEARGGRKERKAG